MIRPYRYPLILLFALLCHITVSAQKFGVDSFRPLANDVTAFIDPVNDLNGDGCALIKIEAPHDFEFSSPLGIVKRENKTGEVWLYLPKGSKMITLKHPRLGVLRDYRFPSKLESHMTYEMRLTMPEELTATQTPTQHDTLLVVRTDTLLLRPEKIPTPFAAQILLTVGMGGGTSDPVGGIMLTAMKRVGGFVHVMTDFGKIGPTVGTCDRYGVVSDGRTPYYSGKVKHSMFMVNAGCTQRIGSRLVLFEGVGYGRKNTAWNLAQSEGGGYVRNTRYCHSGISLEAGAIYHTGRLAVSASLSTLKGKLWYGSIGVGITLGRNPRKAEKMSNTNSF